MSLRHETEVKSMRDFEAAADPLADRMRCTDCHESGYNPRKGLHAVVHVDDLPESLYPAVKTWRCYRSYDESGQQFPSSKYDVERVQPRRTLQDNSSGSAGPVCDE